MLRAHGTAALHALFVAHSGAPRRCGTGPRVTESLNEQSVLTTCFLNELSTLCESYEDLLRGGLWNRALEVRGDVYRAEGTVHLRSVGDDVM